MKRILFPLIILLVSGPAAGGAFAASAVPDEAVLLRGSRPLGRWTGPAPAPAKQAPADPSWLLRTGARKGLTDHTLPEEADAAPDAAVLRSGSFAPWPGLLADMQEASVLVEPDRIAGLALTKPLLIIPSGGLAGLAGSEFFRAGLAEYVRSGGVVLCFSQQRGADLAALPVPAGPALEAAGWAEDGGALFRASAVQAWHPVLAGVPGTLPAVETDGAVRSAPAGARTILSRADGRATLLVYPYGRGQVMVSMLASDVGRLQGLLAGDERTIVRNMVLWAKAGGSLRELGAGERFESVITVRLPEGTKATSVRFDVLGPDRAQRQQSQAEHTIPLDATSAPTTTVAFRFWVPADASPGIFRTEYVLLDGKRTLTQPIETPEGLFAVVPRPAPAPPVPPQAGAVVPLPPVAVTVAPVLAPAGSGARLTLAIARTSGDPGEQALVARAAGQERRIMLGGDRSTVTFDLAAGAAHQVSYAVSHAGGRVLARGSAAAAPAPQAGVSVDRPWYAAGQTVRVSVTGMGPGALTLTGPGTELSQHISTNRVFDLPLPPSLPGGIYPLLWEFETRAGTRQQGSVPIHVSGMSVECTAATFRRTPNGGEAVLTITASQAVAAVLSARFSGPDGALLPAVERGQALKEGEQTVVLPLPFSPERAGIWQLLYAVAVRLPDGPGFSRDPVTLSSGRLLADAGSAAVLDIRLDRPLYYDPEKGAGGRAYVYASRATSAEVALDQGRPKRTKIGQPGMTVLPFSLDRVGRGQHTVRVTAAGSPPAEARSRFLYGARLPDLTVSIKSSDAVTPGVEIGIGITNRGRTASGHAAAAVFEGDPGRGGSLISSFTVPPLEPGRSFVAVVPWSLAGKAGDRTLLAVIDRDRALAETDDDNNSASLTLQVPELLLGIVPKKDSFQSGEPLDYILRAINFSAAGYRPLLVDIQVTEPRGRTLAPETVRIPELASGAEISLERSLNPVPPQEGTYLLRVTGRTDRVIASDSSGITVVPTLFLTGSLEGTPAVASPCMPFSIRYSTGSIGTVRPVSGTLRLEVLPRTGGRALLERQLPFTLGKGTAVIDRVDLPQGDYTLVFRGSAANPEAGMTRDFLFAELPLTVAGPVEVQRSSSPFPRVLLWTGGEDATPIARALGDKLVKEAFGDGDLLLKVVTSANDFSNHALTGLYTTYVLLEINGLLDTVEVLRNGLAAGHGVVVIGSDPYSRTVAEGLGFRFTGPPSPAPAGLTFPPGTGLSVTGTVPLAGDVLVPAGTDATTIAVYPDGRPALLLDARGPGKALLFPFSMVRSSLHTGISSLYSLVLRESAHAVAPGRTEAGTAALQLSYRAPAGSTRARIVETLPEGAEILWTSARPDRKGGTMAFEVTADQDPASLLILFRPRSGGPAGSTTEVFHQCEGKYVSQGKIE